MKRSRRTIRIPDLPVPALGMSHSTAQALLTYLRGCGGCDAGAIELITYCARRAREAN
jgi:hypothetical protein